MKQTIIAVLVVGSLTTALGQDTVQLPDADFWVVLLIPEEVSAHPLAHARALDRARALAKGRPIQSWMTGKATQEWSNRARRARRWTVYYALPGNPDMREAVLSRKVGGVPTREEVRLAVRTHMLKRNVKPTRPPGEVWKVVGRYYREKLRRRLPLPTTGRW